MIHESMRHLVYCLAVILSCPGAGASHPLIAGIANPSPSLLKTCIEQLARAARGGALITPDQLRDMEEAVQLLEQSQSGKAMDPTLACGSWNQIFCDNPGAGIVSGNGWSSRRKLMGPLSGKVTQIVSPGESGLPSRYQQRAALASGVLLEARLSASIVELYPPSRGSGLAWDVTFETFGWSTLRGALPLRRRQLPPGGGGKWRTTYLDESWRVMRAGSRRAEGKESLYVLRRC